MPSRIVVFFPHQLYPPQTGAHQRGLQIVSGLRQLGHHVLLTGTTLHANPQWNLDRLDEMKPGLVDEVRIFQPSRIDLEFIWLLKRVYRRLRKKPRINSALRTPPGMRFWFRNQALNWSADAVLINYAYWDGLVNFLPKHVTRFIDVLDLVTWNEAMWGLVYKYLPRSPIPKDAISSELIEEKFYDRRGLAAADYEFQIYDKFHFTIAISGRDAELIRQRTHKTKTLCIPMSSDVYHLPNSYTGDAIFATGPNPFNEQGYYYFVKAVLPHILQKESSFQLRVTGYVSERVLPEQGVVLCGFLPDLKPTYQVAAFSICPVFGGTGQQIKIVEAMAHGLPVIALNHAAQSSPIKHGENGLVAHNAEEFAEYTIQLWRDRDLCRRLGQSARETISTQYSNRMLIEKLAMILQ